MSEIQLTPPKPTKGDTGHALVRAALSVIPGVGGPAVEFFSWLIMPPLEKRRLEWMQNMGQELQRLCEAGVVDGEKLRDDPVFFDTLLQATDAAMRTSNQVKLDALRNAVANATRPESPEAVKQQMFLRWVDDFNEWHIRMLDFVNAPMHRLEEAGIAIPRNYNANTYRAAWHLRFPDERPDNGLCAQLWRDLQTAGLVVSDKQGLDLRTDIYVGPSAATQLGKDFLRFIAAPDVPGTSPR